MADEEQFSLCWNNFNTNLSAGFHESLCRGDLVDVTLAAEGQLVKAHRLVLSVCSPYFRKMFTQMPANQHAFVFLKDVGASVLKDLIQFMYCGEVNVKQEALPAFISTAEALQIKGLTEANEGTVTATGLSASPAKEVVTSTPLPDASSQRTRASRIIAARPQAFKIESEGSSDEKQTVTLVQTSQQGKRLSRSSLPAAAPKRIKMQQTQDSADPLDEPEHEIVTPQHLKVSENTEFIDLPIEATHLNPKTEPEYVEDTQEIETEQDEDQYVDEVTYGEEKYDESYFTEGDDKAGVSGFTETYATEGDQSATEAQEYHIILEEEEETSTPSRKKPPTKSAKMFMADVTFNPSEVQFVNGQRGSRLLSIGGYNFVKNRSTDDKTYWICSRKFSAKCNARVVTEFTKNSLNENLLHLNVVAVNGKHTHEADPKAVKPEKAEKISENLKIKNLLEY